VGEEFAEQAGAQPVDLLVARSDVDASRIVAVGRGGASIPALFAALFDNRIKSLALDGMLVSYEAAVKERIHQGIAEQTVPSALKYFDLPDLVAAQDLGKTITDRYRVRE